MSKQNTRLFYNTLIYFVAYGSSLAMSFVLTPYLVQTFGKETYSFYTIATNLSSYMMTVCNALNIMACRYIALELNRQQFQKANDYFKSVFLANGVLCLVMTLPMAAIVIFLERLMDVPVEAVTDVKWLFGFVFTSLIVNVMGSLFSICTVARDRIDLRAYKEVSAGLLRLALIFGGFALFVPRIRWIGTVMLCVSLFNVVVDCCYTKKLTPELSLGKGTYRGSHIKEIIISSVWNTLNALGGNLLSGMAIILLNVLISAEAGSYLSIVHTPIGLLNGVITAVITAFYPRMLQSFSQSKEALLRTTRKLQLFLSVITNVAVAGVALMCADFFRLWMPDVDTEVLQRFTWIQICSVFFTGNVYLYNNVNTLTLNIKAPALVLCGAAVLNIVGSWILASLFEISAYGLVMFNVAINSAYYLVFLPLSLRQSLKTSPMPIYRNTAVSLLSTGLSLVCGGWLAERWQVTGWLGFFGKVACVGVLLLLINAGVFFLYAKLTGRASAADTQENSL